MSFFEFTSNDREFQRRLDLLEAALDEEAAGALDWFGELVENDAVRTHPWQNRTGLLQSRIRRTQVRGRFTSEAGAEITVLGDTYYGGFLEDSPQPPFLRDWSYLRPSFMRVESSFRSIFDAHMRTAISRAGWE